MTNLTVSPIQHTVEVLDNGTEVVVTAPGPQGPRGVTGERGERGERGEKGDAGDAALTFVYQQLIPSSVWEIEHNRGVYFAGIRVVDSAGTEVEGEVTYASLQKVVITFSNGGFSGTCYLS